MTIEQAIQKAKKAYPQVDTVAEYEDAYVFYNSKARGEDNIDNELIILKETGNIISYNEYIKQTKASNKHTVRSI